MVEFGLNDLMSILTPKLYDLKCNQELVQGRIQTDATDADASVK